MRRYTTTTSVIVYPFTRQDEGQDIIIGRADISIFLVLPPDAVELLDYLAIGKTIGEAKLLYRQKYNEVPDLEELLTALEDYGFVQPLEKNETPHFYVATEATNHLDKAKYITKRYHFTNFPQSLAKQLLSRPILLTCVSLIVLALMAVVVEPSVLPGWDAYFFQENLTLMRLTLVLLNYTTLFLHELAHLIAARAVGVFSRLGISNRMWYLVAETDMTGIWSIPRNQRFLPFLAGSLLDATSASILILIFFTQIQGYFTLHPVIFQLSRALLLTYLMRLLWQCYLFIRTDFYFVIANFFKCKSLMRDTETYLRNQIAKFIHTNRQINQSHIPKSERQIIRWYALLWILGRIAAFGSLIFITAPLLWHYSLKVIVVLSAGYYTDPFAFWDALLLAVIFLLPQFVGFWLWIRSFYIPQR
jgi:hypothetical protein